MAVSIRATVDRDGAWTRLRAYLLAAGSCLADEARRNRFGTLLLTPYLPDIWVLNRLVVTRPGSEIDATDLAAETTAALSGGGRRHARLTVVDDALGQRLAGDSCPSGGAPRAMS